MKIKYAAVTLLALLLFPEAQAEPVKASVFAVKGEAEVAAPGSTHYNHLSVGDTVLIGSTIRTEEDSEVVLVTTPGTAVQIGGDSILKINDLAFAESNGNVTERRANLDLKTGSVSALIDPSTPKITDFRIQTPDGGACARGTFYGVVVKNGKSFVSVKEGKVAAVPRGAPNKLF
jgi:hypothetical protein